MHCILHSVFCVLFSMFCILNSILCFLYSLICILGCMYSVFRSLFPMFCILYQLLCNFVLFCILYSAICFLFLYSVFCFRYLCTVLKEYEKAAFKGIIWTNLGEGFNNSSTFSLPSLFIILERKKLIYHCCLFLVSIQYSIVDEAMGANDSRIH